MQELKIKCKGAAHANVQDLLDFQGDLKTLSTDNYNKFKMELLELGFSEPISVWISPEKKKYILNGHQRRQTLLNMIEEGYVIPEVPINLVDADDYKQAKKKVLALCSQFGQMSQDGLIDFCEKAELEVDTILDEFNFPEVKELNIEEIEDFANKNGEVDIDALDDECKIVLNYDAETFEKVSKLLRNVDEDQGQAVLSLLQDNQPDEF